MRVLSLGLAGTRRVDRIQDPPHRIGCVGRALEQTAFYIEGRSGAGARPLGPLRVGVDVLPSVPGLEAGEQARAVDAGALGDGDQRRARLRRAQLSSVVLPLIEGVVNRPKSALPRG